MRRVAVIGSTGQLGSEMVSTLRDTEAYTVLPLSHADIECADPGSVRRVLSEARPEVVVNCAAFVRVDECEDRPGDAFGVNAIGALNVARACVEVNARCIHVSTDYVFDGEKSEPYTEEDDPRPINVYGASKLAGEHLVQQACAEGLIVRMSSLFGKAGARGKGGNFIETILAKAKAGEPLRVVNDIRMSPTYAVDASRAIASLIEERATGVFHLSNGGSCTWYDFARRTLDLAGLDVEIELISSSDYPTRARRPRNSSLASSRLPTVTGYVFRPWEHALKAYLTEKGHVRGEAARGAGAS